MTQKSNFNKLEEYIEKFGYKNKKSNKKPNKKSNKKSNKVFDYFCAQMFLYDRNLNTVDIKNGIVDGGGDGQIDAMYIFLDKNLIKDIEDIKDINPAEYDKLTIIIIQSTASRKLLTNKIDILVRTFHEGIVEMDADFIETLQPKLQKKIFILKEIINKIDNSGLNYEYNQEYKVYYCTQKENLKNINSQKNAFMKIKEIANSYGITVDNNLISAEELCEKYEKFESFRKNKKKSLTIYHHSSKSKKSAHIEHDNIFVVLVRLKDYREFLKKEDGTIEDSFFENNIRAYQGKNITNKGITNFFIKDETPSFWHLNNGITIIVDQAEFILKGRIKLKNPQIVNGLQTSQIIFDNLNKKEKDFVLIKIIKNKNNDFIGDIIKATNTQTAIQRFSLFANDKIHKAIEEFLKDKGYLYERKKKFYSDKKKYPHPKQIITMKKLTQYLIATVMQEPDTAMARPGNLFNDTKLDEERYKQIFGYDNLDKKRLPVYHNAILIADKAEKYLLKKTKDKSMQRNLLFLVMTCISRFLIKKENIDIAELAELKENDIKDISDIILDEIYGKIEEIYNEYGSNARAAKSVDMTKDLKAWLKIKFS